MASTSGNAEVEELDSTTPLTNWPLSNMVELLQSSEEPDTENSSSLYTNQTVTDTLDDITDMHYALIPAV
jgi:hypothetical protein